MSSLQWSLSRLHLPIMRAGHVQTPSVGRDINYHRLHVSLKPYWNSVATKGKLSWGLWPHRRVTPEGKESRGLWPHRWLTVERLLWEPFPHKKNVLPSFVRHLSTHCLSATATMQWRPTPDACAMLLDFPAFRTIHNHTQNEILLFTIHAVWNSAIRERSKLRSLV